jgi:hypothetical protein
MVYGLDSRGSIPSRGTAILPFPHVFMVWRKCSGLTILCFSRNRESQVFTKNVTCSYVSKTIQYHTSKLNYHTMIIKLFNNSVSTTQVIYHKMGRCHEWILEKDGFRMRSWGTSKAVF